LAEEIAHVSDDSFEEEVLKSELPVLVDFWAVWCAPCHMVAPSVENLAQTYKDKMKVVKFNVDENPKTPANYGILSIPTLLLWQAWLRLSTPAAPDSTPLCSKRACPGDRSS